jgi:predicted metal-dependent peptidase
MSSARKITEARARLILSHSFFGTLALRLKMTEDRTIPTACTNGAEIRYNPAFINELPSNQIKGLVAHEVMHCVLLHHIRRGSRDPQKWNYACDFAINLICAEASLELPPGALIDRKYNGMSSEEIYSKLPELPPNQQYSTGFGEVTDAPGEENSNAGSSFSETEWKIAVTQAAQIAKQAGKLPARLEGFVDELLSPQIPWRDVLRRFITERSKDDYSWTRPNRRHIASGIYLPTAWSESMGPIVVGVDTSGSIGQKELDTFSAEINVIIQDVRPSKTYVVYCDAAVNRVDEFEPNEEVVLKPYGGGGTDFRPVFDYIDKHDIEPKCLVYLTDMYGTFPNDEPGYPVMWAATTDVKAPFGELLEIRL